MVFMYVLCAVVALLGIYNLWNNTFVYSQFKNFNENVKNWSIEISNDMNRMIWLAANQIIEEKNKNNEQSESDEPCEQNG